MPETPQPAVAAGVPQPAKTSQPPMGVSSATQPTPNKGYEAAAMQRVGVVLNALTEALPMAGATSDLGKAIMSAISSLAKVVPPGSTSPQGQKNSIDQMQAKNIQNQAMMSQMKQGGQGQPGGGGQPPQPQPGMAA